MSKKLVVLGTGGHAKVVIATAHAAGFQVVGAYDDNVERHGAAILGVPILGDINAAVACKLPAVIGIGSNRARLDLSKSLGMTWATLVHPAAVVHETVLVGCGTVIFAGVVVQPETSIGDHAILNTKCSVDHDGTIGSWSHIGPGASLCGGVSIGPGVLVGVGASLIPGVSVGEWSTVGAGAAVIHSCSSRAVVVGVPARPKR